MFYENSGNKITKEDKKKTVRKLLIVLFILFVLLLVGMIIRINRTVQESQEDDEAVISAVSEEVSEMVEVGQTEEAVPVNEIEESLKTSEATGTNEDNRPLTPEQKHGLKEALQGVMYYENYDHQAKDFGELLYDLINVNGLSIKDLYGIPVEDMSNGVEVQDPLCMWEPGYQCYRSDKVLTDECLKKYFNVSSYTDDRQIVYQQGDMIYIYETEGFYYWNMYPLCGIGYIPQIEVIEFIGEGRYKIIYDLFEESFDYEARENEIVYSYIGTREAVAGLVDEAGTDWSLYSISNLGRLENRENTQYMIINPLQVEDGAWVEVEGILQKGESPDATNGGTRECIILVLESPIKICNLDGQLVDANEIGITGTPPLKKTCMVQKLFSLDRKFSGIPNTIQEILH